MKWHLFSHYAQWFYIALAFFALLDIYLIWRHFKSKQEDFIELVSRILGSNFFGLYLFYRIIWKVNDTLHYQRFQTWQGWLQWLIIVTPFAIFFWSYLFRAPAKGVANRMREIIFPLFCSLIPFVVYESGSWVYGGWIQQTAELRALVHPFYPGGYIIYVKTAFFLILIGDVITLWGIFYLKRSFSIMTEVRVWVNAGPYRWIRHPLYCGEIISTLGFCLMKFSYLNIFLTLLFFFCILLRARYEEAKMIQFYPEYENYRMRVGFLFPKWKAR